MEGLTATEMAEKLSIKLKTVKKRLEAAKIRPLTKEDVYPFEALETIKNIQMGRPAKKPKTPEPAKATQKPRKPPK
jgi:predicted ArsR family transcriptional regulator